MYNENEVRLIGNLGRDPQVHDNGDGQKVAQLSLATSRRWKDNDGEWFVYGTASGLVHALHLDTVQAKLAEDGYGW